MSCLNPLHQKIVPLALGELDPAEWQPLAEHLERCSSCSKELDLLADLVAIAAHPLPTPPPRIRSSTRHWVPRVAGVLIAVFVVLGLFDQYNDAKHGATLAPFADTSVPPFLITDVDGGDTPWGDEFESAMQSWDRGDFGDVEKSLGKFLDLHPDHAPARLYHGIAERKLGKLDAARADLRLVSTASQGPLREQALWNLANLELESNSPSDARKALDELVQLNGEYGERAKELEERLEVAK